MTNEIPYERRRNAALPWGYWARASGSEWPPLYDEQGNEWRSVREYFWIDRLGGGSAAIYQFMHAGGNGIAPGSGVAVRCPVTGQATTLHHIEIEAPKMLSLCHDAAGFLQAVLPPIGGHAHLPGSFIAPHPFDTKQVAHHVGSSFLGVR